MGSTLTIIGKIPAYPAMKRVISQTARIVSFFNGSHYWGGQLDDAARGMNISRSMKTNTDDTLRSDMTLQNNIYKNASQVDPSFSGSEW
jgi:uncharacterized membrane protein